MEHNALVIVKPDAMEFRWDIMDIIDQYADRQETIYRPNVPEEIVKKHYQEHQDKPFYQELVDSMKNKDLLIADYQLKSPVNYDMNWFKKNVIGDTNPDSALEGTIRREFGKDMTRNAVHCSDPESYAREYKLWFNKDKGGLYDN